MKDPLADLRAGAQFDSNGHFSMDAHKAQLKMQSFGLIDQHEYVLCVVRAAVAAGARRIDVYTGVTVVEVTVEGWNLEPTFFDEPLAGLFFSQERREVASYRLLAIALNAALGLKPRALEVETQQASLHMRGADKWERRAGHESMEADSFRLRVSGHLGWDWANRALQSSVGWLPESRLLRQKAMACPLDLWLNGSRLCNGDWASAMGAMVAQRQGLVAQRGFSAAGCRGIIAVAESTLLQSGAVTVLYHGVELAACTLDLLGAFAIVYADEIDTNASLSKVVENDHWRQVVTAIHDNAAGVLIGVYAKLTVGPVSRELRRFALSLLAAPPPYYAKEMALFESIKLFNMLDGTIASLQQLRDWVGLKQPLYYMRSAPDNMALAARVVLLTEEKEQFLIPALGSNFRRLDETASRRVRHESQGTAARLDRAANYLFIDRVEVEGYNGEVGLRVGALEHANNRHAQVSFYVNGNLICSDKINIGDAPFEAAIEHPMLATTPAWDGVVADDKVYKRGLTVLAAAFVAAAARRLSKETARVPPLQGHDPVPGSNAAEQQWPIALPSWREPLARCALECMRLMRLPVETCPWALSHFEMFDTVDGSKVTLITLMGKQTVRWVKTPPPHPVHTEELVLSGGEAVRLLGFFAPQVQLLDVSVSLQSMMTPIELSPALLPTLPAGVRFVVPIQRDRMVGKVGLLCSNKGGEPSVMLTNGVVSLGRRPLHLPFGPLDAVVWSQDVRCNDKDGRVIVDGAMQDVHDAIAEAAASVAQLAATNLPGMAGTTRDVVVRFLLDFMAAAPAHVSPAVRQAACFHTVHGRAISRDALFAELERSGKLRFVRETVAGAPPEEPILLPRYSGESSAWIAIFGRDNLVDATVRLRQEHEKSEFYRRPLESTELPHPEGKYLRVVGVEDGVVGIKPAFEPREVESKIVVLLEGRRLGVVSLKTSFQMEGILNRDDFVPGEGWRGVGAATREHIDRLLCGVEDELARSLAPQAAPHSLEARLCLKYALNRHSGATAAAVAEQPLLTDSTGRRHSLSELRRELVKHDGLLWVPPDQHGQPLGERLVWHLEPDEVELLRWLTPKMVDYSEQLSLDVELARRREKTGAVSLELPADGAYVARLRVEGGGMQGELALAPGAPRGVKLVYRGVPIEKRSLYSSMPIIGVLECEAFRVNASWREVRWDQTTGARLDALLDRLYERVIGDDTAHSHLFEYILYRGEKRVSAAVANAELFPLCDGGRASLGRLLKARQKWGHVAYARAPGEHADEPSPVVCVGEDDELRDFLIDYFGRLGTRNIDAAWRGLQRATQEVAEAALAKAKQAAHQAAAAVVEAESEKQRKWQYSKAYRDKQQREQSRQREAQRRREQQAEENLRNQDPRAAAKRELLARVTDIFEGWAKRPHQHVLGPFYRHFALFELRSSRLVDARWPNVTVNSSHRLLAKLGNDAEAAARLACAIYDATMADRRQRRTPEADAEWTTWVLYWVEKKSASTS